MRFSIARFPIARFFWNNIYANIFYLLQACIEREFRLTRIFGCHKKRVRRGMTVLPRFLDVFGTNLRVNQGFAVNRFFHKKREYVQCVSMVEH